MNFALESVGNDLPLLYRRPLRRLQVVEIAVDLSPSMLERLGGEPVATTARSKLSACSQCLSSFVDRLRSSGRADMFRLGVTGFAERAERLLEHRDACDVSAMRQLAPLPGARGTSIAAALAIAARPINEFLQDDEITLPRSAVVVIRTDGRCLTPDATRTAAHELRNTPGVTLAVGHFPSVDRAEAARASSFLSELVGASGSYRSLPDSDTLRSFLDATVTRANTQ